MLGVLMVHFSYNFPAPDIVKSIARMGANCVQIFFVISGYLACSYFLKPNACITEYYKKRALRILPIYYAAIIAAMLCIEFFSKGHNSDVFHLGWIRYFLGLNTILPSADFYQWNNVCGFWTMTDFICFYAVIPLLIRFAYTFHRCIILFFILLIIARLAHTLGYLLPLNTCFDKISLLIEWSPLVQMQHFGIGMLTFFAVRENKKSIACVILIAIAMLPTRLCDSHLLFSILTGLFIMSVQESDIAIHGAKRTCLHFLAKYSFHVYLTHLLALRIASKISYPWCEKSLFLYFTCKLSLSIIITILLCIFLEMVQRLAIKLFSTKKQAIQTN